MRFSILLLLGALSFACGGPPPEQAPVAAEAEQSKPPVDERRRFPKEGLTEMLLVSDHLMGKDYLPGGNLASYEKDGTQYQQFLLQSEDDREALGLLSSIKDELEDRKFVAAFGGYYGQMGGVGWFVFLKQNYLLGITGLPQDEADLIARDFAARIY